MDMPIRDRYVPAEKSLRIRVTSPTWTHLSACQNVHAPAENSLRIRVTSPTWTHLSACQNVHAPAENSLRIRVTSPTWTHQHVKMCMPRLIIVCEFASHHPHGLTYQHVKMCMSTWALRIHITHVDSPRHATVCKLRKVYITHGGWLVGWLVTRSCILGKK